MTWGDSSIAPYKIMNHLKVVDRDWLFAVSSHTKIEACQIKLLEVRFKTNNERWFVLPYTRLVEFLAKRCGECYAYHRVGKLMVENSTEIS